MAAKVVAAAPAKASVIKREPALFATGAVTLIATLAYVAPSLGIEIPDSVAKIVSLVLTVAAGFGIRSAVVPIAKK